MTCIIGLEANGKVYIGGDSCSADGWISRTYDVPKVFRVKDFLVGYTTSFRMGQLLQYNLTVSPQNGTDDMTYIVTIVVEAVRKLFKDYGYAKIENSRESGGLFLIGYRGRLYQVADDFQALHVNEFSAVGCGYAVALGAMAALNELSPKKRILKSLEIVEQFDGNVRPPYTVLKL